jgi:PhnB protein
MSLSVHLTYNGQCEAAFRFYESCLKGKIALMLKYGDSPMAPDVPDEWHDKIVHANLLVGEQTIAGADVLPNQYEAPRGFFVLLDIADPSTAESVFQTLAEKGTVRMPLQKTFWAERFGVLIDQFGIPWEINCAKL